MTNSEAPYHVLCFGEVLWDYFADNRHPGGAPLNVAYHLSKLNCSAHLLSAVGDDDDGRQLLDMMRSFGLDTNLIETRANLPTGRVDVVLDDGIPAYTIVEPVAWDAIDVSAHESALRPCKADAIVYGSLSQRSEKNRESLDNLMALYPDALRVFDVNLRPPHSDLERVRELLTKAQLVKVNEEELEILTTGSACPDDVESRTRFFSDTYGCAEVCVTRGAQGASMLHGGKWLSVGSEPVQAVDTVGAGDAFLAALIASIGHKTADRVVGLRRASRLAGFVTTCAGATPSYRAEDILENKQ